MRDDQGRALAAELREACLKRYGLEGTRVVGQCKGAALERILDGTHRDLWARIGEVTTR